MCGAQAHSAGSAGTVVEELARPAGAHYAWQWMQVARLSLVVGWLILGPAVVSCAGPDAAARRQMDEFRRDIDRIQADNEKLNDRLTSLETAEASKQAAKEGDAGARPSLDVVRIGPDGGADEESASEGDTKDGDETPTVIRAEGTREPSVKRGASGADRGAQAGQAYEDALELVKKKRYDDALEALAGYLVRFPSDANADNATYWRGECYYAKGDYVRAAEQFEAVLARFPNGNKVADALLKLGLSQRAMGERDKARETFERLRKSYPSTDAAKKIPRE